MPASQEDIRQWLERGKKLHSTHMVVVCDLYDYEDYPVYVGAGDNVSKIVVKYNGPNMQRVIEVYNYNVDLETQLAEHRVWNL